MSRIASWRARNQSWSDEFAWRPGNRLKTITTGVMAGSLLALLVFTVIGVVDRKFGSSNSGMRLSALTPVDQVPQEAPETVRGAGALDKGFIWDEIVNLSTRFGETPPSAMDDQFIAKVHYWISRFTTRGYHRELLKRRENYIKAIDSALKEQNLPAELGYLVWIESAYETEVVSSAGARGLWQLMPATAREYGLRVDLAKKIDERTDPIKSSRAAAAYLTLLLKTFGSQRYLLAIASYNTGQNRVKRFQIASTIKSSRVPDFWHLSGLLPAETVDYVPKFLAAVIVARNPGRF